MPHHRDWPSYADWKVAVIDMAEDEGVEIDGSDEHLEPKWKSGDSPTDAVMNDGLEGA
jgi:hypothetical protein